MSTNTIDARGIDCPGPVIAVKKALEGISAGIVTILVDNMVAKENVMKFATAHGCGVSITKDGENFLLTISKGESPVEILIPVENVVNTTVTTSGGVYVFTHNTLGKENPELGAILMKGFIYALIETVPKPSTLLFMNSGVLLTIEGSPVIDHLTKLSEEGVEILSCGTCLDYLDVKDKLAIGGITNMYTIVEKMTAGNKVITL